MRFTKKRLALSILAVVMALPGLSVAVSPFVDVAPGKFYEAPVNWAFSNHITTGKDATHFDPNGAVTRGESVTFLKRYHDNVVKQSVGALGCTTDQVAYHNGSGWVCGSVQSEFQLTPTSRTLVDSGGSVGLYSSAIFGADGLPFIAYYDTTNGNLKFIRCNTDDCRTGFVVSADSTGDVGVAPSAALTKDGRPIVSYHSSSAGSLKVMVCGTPDCFFQAIRTIDNTGNVGRYSSIAVRPDGKPVIAYYDTTRTSLKFAVCNLSDCSSGASIRELDNTGSVGSYPSVAIGKTGNPIISYQDSATGAGQLRVYSCDDPSCSSGTARTIDNGPLTGFFTSIAIGTDGNPVISYWDGSGKDLRIIACADPTCSSSTAHIVDSTGIVGEEASIAIAQSGNPIVSYYDQTNGDLKLYECAVTNCASGMARTLATSGDVGRGTALAVAPGGDVLISYYDTSNADLMVEHLDSELVGVKIG